MEKKLQNGDDQRVLRAVAAVIVVSGIMDISAEDGKSFCSALALIMLCHLERVLWQCGVG